MGMERRRVGRPSGPAGLSTINRRRGPSIAVLEIDKVAPPMELRQIDKHIIRDPRHLDVGWLDYLTTERLDQVNIPLVLEQPRLIMSSAFQPILRHLLPQMQRGHIRAPARFGERFVYVGHMTKQVDARKRMQGIPTRAAGGGYVYVYPQFFTGNRAVNLGAAK
jgi:hypothetical protein